MEGHVDLPQLPHRAPWLLVDGVVARGDDRVECVKRLGSADPLLFDGTLPGVLLLEALAQAAACFNVGDVGRHRGMLVAATGFEILDTAHAGETLRLVAKKEASLGALVKFSGEAFCGERPIARAQMTFAVEKLP
jgi:3-hydroxymyristoyl/3-hydroxydecanoyl-(acyl carrier protein) dehydratase